jgi:uncharacterized protein YggE
MTDSIKNGVGVAAILGILLVGYAAAVYSGAYSSSIEPGSYRSFSVSGEGKIVVVPDVAQVSYSIVTEGGKDLAALQKTNTEKVNKAIEFVKSKGVDSKDIRTESYNISPRYTTYNCSPRPIYYGAEPSIGVEACPPSEISGYTISQSVSVKVRDFAKIGDILTGVVTAGANNVSGPSFVVDDPTKARNEARAEAIKKAQASAEEIARAGGFGLGRLLGIDEGGYPGVYYDKMAYGMGGGDVREVAMPAPAIEPGSQDVVVTVNLRYEIK